MKNNLISLRLIVDILFNVIVVLCLLIASNDIRKLEEKTKNLISEKDMILCKINENKLAIEQNLKKESDSTFSIKSVPPIFKLDPETTISIDNLPFNSDKYNYTIELK